MSALDLFHFAFTFGAQRNDTNPRNKDPVNVNVFYFVFSGRFVCRLTQLPLSQFRSLCLYCSAFTSFKPSANEIICIRFME